MLLDTEDSEQVVKVEKKEEIAGESGTGIKESEQSEGTSEIKENEQEEEGDDKKKKKKKKKKGKEEEAPKTKKPARGVIKQMQEALEKAKLEQERLRQEEEAKIKALEEAENRRLEKVSYICLLQTVDFLENILFQLTVWIAILR